MCCCQSVCGCGGVRRVRWGSAVQGASLQRAAGVSSLKLCLEMFFFLSQLHLNVIVSHQALFHWLVTTAASSGKFIPFPFSFTFLPFLLTNPTTDVLSLEAYASVQGKYCPSAGATVLPLMRPLSLWSRLYLGKKKTGVFQ